jgi:hypothetical protein
METEFADQPSPVKFLAAELFQKIKFMCIFASKQYDVHINLFHKSQWASGVEILSRAI